MNVSFFRKYLVLTIVFLFVGTSIIPSTGFGTDVSNDPFLGNVDIDPTVELTVNDPVIVFGGIQIDENTFTTLEIPNNGFTIIEGEAKLPLIRHMVEIPQNATPEIVVTSVFWNHVSLDEMDLSIKIVPVQPSVIKTAPEPDFIIDDNYYSKSEFMQIDIARIVETGEIRGHRFALIEISPVQYKPSEGELKIMTSCDIRIDLPGSDLTKTFEKTERYFSPAFEELFEVLFVNHASYGDAMRNTSIDQDEYLIIVNDTFYDELMPFASWKESIGYNVTVTNTSQIPGGTAKENIHDYIEDAYNNWTTPPSYVLLVGDTGEIPTYTNGAAGTATDLFYVTMDGADYFPDIFIGRFPAAQESHVTAIADKTIYYEQGNFASNDWIKKAVFMAGNDNYDITEGTHNYVISNYLDPHNYTCDKLYEVTYGATTLDVKNSFNDGRSLAIFSGHGAVTYWDDGPKFYQSDVNGLTNQDMYPFVCSHACKTGRFDYDECFGETMVRAENKAGLAFWGSSHNTYWDPDDVLEKKMFEAWWVDNIETIGGMTDMALYYHYLYQGGGYPSEIYFECYNILGDPSIKIWRDEPAPNNPPIISNVDVTPSLQNVGGWVNISCFVIDDVGVNSVKANITYPDGTSVNQTMLFIHGRGPENNTYYYNTTYSNIGTYDFYIWASDTSNGQNTSENHSFMVGTLLNITDLSFGWNFISLPFNQSVNSIDVIVDYDGSHYTWDDAVSNGYISDYVFGWNRSSQGYEFADDLEPGYGYWMFANDAYDLLVLGANATFDDDITDIKPNWNIVGVPADQNVSKVNIIVNYDGSDYTWSDAVSSGYISGFIFGWDNSWHSYTFSDTLESGYAYWMYAYNLCKLKH